MKHLKHISENQLPLDFTKQVDEELLASSIDDLLSDHLEIEDVPYSMEEGAMQINYESRKNAAKAIVQFLKNEKII